mmetsp:Transcript_118130/g.329388  ORF Transcript_118130/g.329388 Transcript_118130/m.329388 type:complete len:217 (-) Transcript_118130:71-721(-)|eukprot:CAMPEP_0179088286 /NCGR_PEP_ID=MMETSP0796-20121207/40162_1 /TAXON_ID=73915 /ORGANISM="Pyrodinium bahamense, Strain pbaha01" /LENGTH=216 /DNA_ID=CAMNT_0020785813 /DNA_START=88 /DNA_END=738 /DNA_ORIENTATION=-
MASNLSPDDSGSNAIQTLYAALGVPEDASSEEVTRAYRQKALAEHPDKGGDAARFDEINKAYRVLADEKARSTYDEQLIKEREHAQLVEGRGGAAVAGAASGKQAQAPMRAKTEPTPGSKRQGKLRNVQPGNAQHCALEWRGLGSGAGYLKMLTDDISPEQKTERLLDRYVALPRNKEKRREWVSGLRGKEKQDLKVAAKRREEAEKEKWAKWLAK